MRRAVLLLLFLGLVVTCRASFKIAQESVIADDLALVDAEFGLLEKGDDGTVRFKPAETVPLVAGQGYGWRLRFRTKRPSVALREEFELPAAPKGWDGVGDGANFKVSPDGRTGITEAEATLDDGAIVKGWMVADGDPAGAYVLRIFIEGKLVRTFKFNVVPPPAP